LYDCTRLLDGSIIARAESQADMRQLLEVIRLHDLKSGVAATGCQDRLESASNCLCQQLGPFYGFICTTSNFQSQKFRAPSIVTISLFEGAIST